MQQQLAKISSNLMQSVTKSSFINTNLWKTRENVSKQQQFLSFIHVFSDRHTTSAFFNVEKNRCKTSFTQKIRSIFVNKNENVDELGNAAESITELFYGRLEKRRFISINIKSKQASFNFSRPRQMLQPGMNKEHICKGKIGQ